jgi:hypothetical protein
VLPAIVIVLALDRLYGGVRLPGWEWPVIGAVVLLAAIALAALAVAIGYRFMPDQAQPLTMIIYFAMIPLRRSCRIARPARAKPKNRRRRPRGKWHAFTQGRSIAMTKLSRGRRPFAC